MRPSQSAFTLSEVLISMAILGFVTVGSVGVFSQAHHALFVSTEKTKINRDMRQFTGELTEIARSSNHFFIYESFADSDREDLTDQRRSGQSGDFLVLVYQRPYPTPSDPVMITRLVGYFRAPGQDNRGPVRRFDIQYSTANYKDASTTAIESILPDESTMATHPRVMEVTEGLADGMLFYNFESRSIMIKGQIFHGNAYKRISDTYNFTVSPRG